jgi:hypothetical protein
MDEQPETDEPEPSADADLNEDEDAPEDEVEGHSMAISANFAIDVGGVAKPPVPPVVGPDDGRTPGSGTPTDPKPRVR